MELKSIKGIGVKTLQHLSDEGIYNINDLLLCYPKSYTIYEINNSLLFSGEHTCLTASLYTSPVFIKYNHSVNAIIFYCLVDGIRIKCIMFSSDYLRYKLFKGIEVIIYGRYKKENNEFYVQNIFFDNFEIKVDTDYKLKNISNALMSKAVKSIFASMYVIEDYLPLELVEKYKLLPMDKYIFASHFPKSKDDYIQIFRRRKYEEFFWYAMSLEVLRQLRISNFKVKRVVNFDLIKTFIKSLPYNLTKDQIKAIDDIYKDICNDYPMNRLIQGDVGCGKSIVSYISALMLVLSGYQAVIMVPTEMLAMQQYENICKLLKPFNLNIELLTSSVKNKAKEDILYRLQNNRVNIIVGTHALIEENVKFFKLGIAIIDEQHKFGVAQRAKLISKYNNVDCLYLTATPIPRTLGLSAFGDLDITSIYSMPENRKPVKTILWEYEKIDKLCQSIANHLSLGEQAYIVVPLVLENEDIDAIDINRAYEIFSSYLPDYKIGLAHGKMKSQERNIVMQDFKNKKLDVLLATTVIEVGVDVKNATMIVIMDADRFGLAQIHQLRGRVGRGDLQSYCVLVSNDLNNPRLKVLEAVSDGFSIAVEDLNLRGPGDYLGESQSGFNGLNYSDFKEDFKIWTCAKEDGEEYARKFLKEKSSNPKFLEILMHNKSQKGKIN